MKLDLKTIATRFNSLANHIKSIGLFQTISYFLQRVILKKGNLIQLKIKGLSSPVFLRNKLYDTHIFYQIFVKKEVDFNLNKVPEVILDCGANIGLSTLFFLRKYPSAKIFSIEPEQTNFNLLKRNTDSYENVVQINSAIWKDDKVLAIIDEGGGHASFQVAEKLNSGVGFAQIKATTLTTLMKNFNLKHIDLLKIDIEGSEFEVFESNQFEWRFFVDTLAVEIHEFIKPGATELINGIMLNHFDLSLCGEYSLFKNKSKN